MGKMLPQSSGDAAPCQVQGSASSSECGGANETVQPSAYQACILSACGDIEVCEVEDDAASGDVAALEVMVRQSQQPQHLQQLVLQGQSGKQEQSLTPTGQSSQLEHA